MRPANVAVSHLITRGPSQAGSAKPSAVLAAAPPPAPQKIPRPPVAMTRPNPPRHPVAPAAAEFAGKDRQFVTALARGLDILRAFQPGEGMLGNQEIAHRSGLPKPTVARLTHTLTELGYLTYVKRFRKYELGASVLALGYAALSSMDVREVARPLMLAMAQANNCSTALGGRDRHSMIYLESTRSPAAVGIAYDVGSRISIATSAMGRAWLAAQPEDERGKLIDSIRRRWRSDWAPVKIGIERAIREVSERGFCLSWGEWSPEIAAVGAPLRGPDGVPLYGINAATPIYQANRERIENELGPRLVKLARDVRNGLAARPSPGEAPRRPMRAA